MKELALHTQITATHEDWFTLHYLTGSLKLWGNVLQRTIGTFPGPPYATPQPKRIFGIIINLVYERQRLNSHDSYTDSID